jgi:hypothetical protein
MSTTQAKVKAMKVNFENRESMRLSPPQIKAVNQSEKGC